MTDAKTEIDRISGLAPNADPFSILGIEVFRPVPSAPDSNGDATHTSSAAPSSSADTATADAYERLKVEHTDVRKAYRRLSLLLHSDKCSLEGAPDALLRVSKAYEMLPSEAIVERFIMQLERIKKRDAENKKRIAVAEAERKRKLATGGPPTGNGIVNFNTMTMSQRVAAIAEKERNERSEELSRKADAMAKRQLAERQREEEKKAQGATLAKQSSEFAGLMDL